ncbi:MAG: protein kinase domain-containing protein, partial [Mycobacterium sp.]
KREASTAARLTEPHIIPIHEAGEIDGRLYLVMPIIDGIDVHTLLQRDGPMSPQTAVQMIEQLAAALDAAHEAGLVHRDIKPSNALMTRHDFVYLIDFGIAHDAAATRLTSTGMMVGTLAYMAPERFTAGTADARSDVYSLACVLYECLTGATPYAGDSMEQQIAGHLTLDPPKPSSVSPAIAGGFDAVIAAGMAKKPDERYQSARELATAARHALTEMPTPARDPQPAPTLFAEPTLPAPAPAARQQPTEPTQPHPPPPETPTPPPLPGPPTGDQTSRRRRRIALAGGAAAIATLIVVLAMVFTNGSERANRPPARPANTGPFTGVYRADFGPSATNEKPDQGGTPSTGQWAVRSACRSTGCLATATAAGGPTLQSAFVFDDIGGQWHAVGTASVTSPPLGVSGFDGCQFPAEYWTVITLQPRPDGTLAGQYRATGPPNCETERTVTFTRIGDVDLNSLPDPAGQPVPVASPAAWWHGRYHGTQTPDAKFNPTSWDAIVQTDCLRAGERCVSYSHGDNGLNFYIFSDGKWVRDFDGTGTCSGDASVVDATKYHWEFPLPEPPQDPITLLTGHGHKQITGSSTCVGSYDEELKFERTGD